MPPPNDKLFNERDFRDRLQPFDAHQGLHGQREQRVARENGHGFAEDLVAGGFAAAEIVVVESGQIVVDQRIGVDHLKRAARFERGSVRIDPAIRGRPRPRQAQDGADALAAREQAVTHGAMDGCGRRGFGGCEAIEGRVDAPQSRRPGTL